MEMRVTPKPATLSLGMIAASQHNASGEAGYNLLI